jgi:glycosyltransferase involved in cell wall biosynthesis
MTKPARALYLCYFGLREPLVQTQVLPYLRELAAGGYGMSLLTFEPEMKQRWNADAIDDWRRRLHDDGIEWHMLPYHRRPSIPAKAYDILAGAWRAASIARREKIALFHGRSHAATAMGAIAKWLTGGKLIFDIRGFLAEEYVDSGNWRGGGLLYRLTKAAERWLYRASDGFVVVTGRAKEALALEGPVEVIPCCVDRARFAIGANAWATETVPLDDKPEEGLARQRGRPCRLVFVYAGALGGYYLIEEMADLLDEARKRDPRTYALVLTQSAPSAMIDALNRRGFTSNDYRVMQAAPDEIPKYLSEADVALLLVRPSDARRSMSPTKFAEYLAAGLPVIATAGIGDLDAQIAEGQTGVLLRGLDREAYREALRTIEELRRDPELAARCRAEAAARFDLHDVGGARYRRLYDAVLHA